MSKEAQAEAPKNMDPAKLDETITRTTEWLAEQDGVDSVRIFVTTITSDGMYSGFATYGKGSLFAQKCVCREWVTGHDEIIKEQARQKSFFAQELPSGYTPDDTEDDDDDTDQDGSQ